MMAHFHVRPFSPLATSIPPHESRPWKKHKGPSQPDEYFSNSKPPTPTQFHRFETFWQFFPNINRIIRQIYIWNYETKTEHGKSI